MIMNSFELLKALKQAGYISEERDPLWWPNSLTFEVVIGAILTQQTKWAKVERSLDNLKAENLVDLEALANVDLKQLQTLIKPSGFYNIKAKRLKTLAQNIIKDFGDFERFQSNVTRQWLLEQNGLGEESSDAILCYGCGKEVMVVDNYTQRLLEALGYEFESYEAIQQWLVSGILENMHDISNIYMKETTLSTIYSRLHGMIVEYAKEHIHGKKVNIEELKL